MILVLGVGQSLNYALDSSFADPGDDERHEENSEYMKRGTSKPLPDAGERGTGIGQLGHQVRVARNSSKI